MRIVLILALFLFTFIAHVKAQVRYYRGAGLTSVSLSYSRSEYNNRYADTYSSTVHIAKDSIVDVGFLLAHAIPGNVNGFGVSVERALFRTSRSVGLGASVFGAGSIMFSHLFEPPQSTASTSQAGTIGLELYLRTATGGFELIPFAQISRSFFGKGYRSFFGYGAGIDIVTPVTNRHSIIMTVGALSTDIHQSSVKAALTLCMSHY